MEISKFLYFLLSVSVLFLFYNKDMDTKQKEKEDKPLVVFEESIMYKINDKTVDEIIESKKAYLFKNKEEIFDGIIVKKNENEKNGEKINTVSANHILKNKDQLTLKGNVNLQRDDKLTVKTDYLEYNLKTKIAKSNTKFSALQDNKSFEGVGFYANGKTNYIEADKIHFKVKLKDTDEIK
ncbi:MAG: LPS export ABC transporter periplasmic protein LptC [Campylobacterota bacterium]|nr:LPS export ABC transporter periplasmic protein LptC [Campylobacterota bacterium]